MVVWTELFRILSRDSWHGGLQWKQSASWMQCFLRGVLFPSGSFWVEIKCREGLWMTLHAPFLGLHKASISVAISPCLPMCVFLKFSLLIKVYVVTWIFLNQILFLHSSFGMTQVISHFSGSSVSYRLNTPKFSFPCPLLISSASLSSHRPDNMLRASSSAISQCKLSWRDGEFINVVCAYLIKFLGWLLRIPEEKNFQVCVR